MIGYIHNGIVETLQATIDASVEPVIRLYSISEVTLIGTSNAVLTLDREHLYDLDISKCTDGEVVTLQNAIGQQSITVQNQEPRTDYLISWLAMQQLGYLVPMLKKIGWSKLKEAALKAKQIMDLAGTEQALSMMQKLIEVDDNFQLFRYWRRQIDNIDDLAYDNLTAVDLADAGYKPTGKLKAIYYEDRLNPWTDKISDTVQAMLLTIDEVITCISGILPATLQISDYDLIRLGIGLISFDIMSSQNSLQTSDTDIDIAIDIPSILQYSYEPFVYNLETLELIRIADYAEQNAQQISMVVLPVTIDGTVYSFCLHIGDWTFEAPELSGTKQFCITPAPGTYEATYSYITESGNRFTHTKTIQVLQASSRQAIYEICEANASEVEPSILEPFNVTNVIMQWMHVVETCNGRPYNIQMPKSYQQFWLAEDATKIRVITIDDIVKYDFGPTATIPGFTTTTETVNVFNETGSVAQQTFNVLTTIDYAGKYDIDVQYLSDNQWHSANMLSKYLTEVVQPMWPRQTLLNIKNAVGANTALIDVNGNYANDEHYIDISGTLESITDQLQTIETCMLNIDNDGSIASMSVLANEAWLTMQYDEPVSVKAVRRQMSFGLKTALTCNDSVPYIVCRANTWIELYSNDNLVSQGYGILVFAKTTGNAYYLHLHNDWYDKTINI